MLMQAHEGEIVMLTLEQVEATALSMWIRQSESVFAFQGILVLHVLGMATAAGATAAMALRLLGFARQIPLGNLRELVRVAWAGLLLSFLSGTLLVIAYPTKALTNPVFYVKLLLLAGTVAAVGVVDRRVAIADSPRATDIRKWTATALLVLITLTIVTGRLLPYTYRYILAPP